MEHQALIHQFFSAFGLTPTQIHLSVEGDMLTITLDVPETESGRFIGRYASTLDSLQLILSLMLNNGSESHLHVLIDVGGYRAERQAVLESMAERLTHLVTETGTPHSFPPLSSTDRRSLHLLFKDHETLKTESVGEGQNRRLILSLKD